MRRLFYFFISPTMFVWNTNSIATSLCYKQYFGCAVDLSGIAYNGLCIRDVALIRMLKLRHKAQCAISFIRCYVLGGLSALNLI